MDLNFPVTFWIVYTICNIMALVALVVTLEKPIIARLLYSLFFGVACVVSAYIAFFRPRLYTEIARYTFLPIYKSFILGWFSQNTQPFVLGIATLLLWVALSIWGKGRLYKIGSVTGIIILALLLPLGLGTAFPAPLNLALGLRILLNRQSSEYLWPVLLQNFLKTKSDLNR